MAAVGRRSRKVGTLDPQARVFNVEYYLVGSVQHEFPLSRHKIKMHTLDRLDMSTGQVVDENRGSHDCSP
jgi:hypothetical protein